jgi:hypothetical protein
MEFQMVMPNTHMFACEKIVNSFLHAIFNTKHL